MKTLEQPFIVLRGGGDLASGVALRLWRAGFTRLLILECAKPLAVRRTVAFCEAVYEKTCLVENVTGQYVGNVNNAHDIFPATSQGGADDLWQNIERIWAEAQPCIPVLVDETGACLAQRRPHVFIEATLRKKAVDIHSGMAELVVALGPGHSAPEHAHAVIETHRGHSLGRVIWKGHALENTGVPGAVAGYGIERLLRAPCAGVFTTAARIGDTVHAGGTIGFVEADNTKTPVCTAIDGLVRGLLRSGTPCSAHMKVGDVDARLNVDYMTVSEKALAIGGGVLEVVCQWYLKNLFEASL